MTSRIIIDEIDCQLRKVRLNGVPERRDLRRRRARLMAEKIAAPVVQALPRPSADPVQRASAGREWTLGEILQLALIRLPTRL